MIPKILRESVTKEVVKEKEIPENFYFSKNFPAVNSPEDIISWDIFHKDRGMAPITARETQAPLWKGGGYSTMLASPAFIQEKISHTEKELNDANSPDAAKKAMYEMHLTEKVEDLVGRNDRTVEFLAARLMLQHGVISYEGPNNLRFNIDFKFPTSFKKALTGNDVWGTGSTRNVAGDIATAKTAVKDGCGEPVTGVLMNDMTLKLLSGDSDLATLLYASAFGSPDLNMVVDPLTTLTATLKVPIVVYDESMPLTLEIKSGSAKTWVVAAPAPIEAGTKLTFQRMGMEDVEDEEVGIVDSYVAATKTITLVDDLTFAYRAGHDLIQASIPFLKDRRVVFMAGKFRGRPTIEFRDCPFGLPVGQRGKVIKTWEKVDPDATYTRVQRSGLWLPRTSKAVYTLDV